MCTIKNILSAILTIIFITSFNTNTALTVTSSAFTNNGIIPARYSCEGKEVSPPLQIGNVPSSAKSLALIVHDPDAAKPGGMIHGVLWNLDISGNIPENYRKGEQGLNGKKQHGYIGMCPPSGTHHYYFKVYALDCSLSLDKDTDESALKAAINGHVVAEGEIVGLYTRK